MEVDETKCPFCKGENKCGAKLEGRCWCADIEVPTSIRELIPEQFRMKACICKSCIEKYVSDPLAFEKKYSADF